MLHPIVDLKTASENRLTKPMNCKENSKENSLWIISPQLNSASWLSSFLYQYKREEESHAVNKARVVKKGELKNCNEVIIGIDGKFNRISSFHTANNK